MAGGGGGGGHIRGGSRWVVASVRLLLALSMGTMCAPDLPPVCAEGFQGNGGLVVHRELVGLALKHPPPPLCWSQDPHTLMDCDSP